MIYSFFRYSRRVLWLRVGTSNSSPTVVAFHFLSAVEEIRGRELHGGMVLLLLACMSLHLLSHDIIANSCALQEHHVSFVVIWGRKIHIWLFCSHSLEEMDWTAMLESSVFATEDRCRWKIGVEPGMLGENTV